MGIRLSYVCCVGLSFLLLVGCDDSLEIEVRTAPPSHHVSEPVFEEMAPRALLEKASDSLRRLPMSKVHQGGVYIIDVDRRHFGLDLPIARKLVAPERAREHRDRKEALSNAKWDLLNRLGTDIATNVVYQYDSLPQIAVWLDEDQLAHMLRANGVERVHANQMYTPATSSSLSFIGIPSSGGENADGAAGAGTIVAVIDSGARYWAGAFGSCGTQNNPQFSNGSCHMTRISNHTNCNAIPSRESGWECKSNGGDFETVAAGAPHGTGVTGVVKNVAPGAGLWSLNVTHLVQPQGNSAVQEERIYDAEIIAALNDVNSNPTDVVAVNMSLGSDRNEGTTSYCNTGVGSALETLWDNHGIVATIATGNEGTKNAISLPACSPFAIAVGAQYDTDANGAQANFGVCSETVSSGEVACFSNSQHSVDIIAPGVLIAAGGLEDSGTSLASPHVAGYVAELQSRFMNGPSPRRLDAYEVATRLRLEAVNRSETAQGQDGATYSYVHRRLSATSGIDPDTLYPFHTNPNGLSIGSGSQTTLTMNTSSFNSVNGDQTGQEITDVWLDVEIGHSSASQLELVLTSPGGAQYTIGNFQGSNLNQVFGVQSNTSLRNAFDGAVANGQWQLRIENNGGGTAQVIRAVLLFNTQAAQSPQSSFQSFSLGRSSVTANGSQIQTFRLTLANAGNVDSVRIATNFAWHVENGRSTSGFFQITPSDCIEVGSGSGNADVDLQDCSVNNNPDGSVEYVLNFAVESTFGAAQNNQVSAIWYEQGVSVASWTRVTQSGAGFNVVASEDGAPASLGGFSFDRASVEANGFQVQTFRLTLDNAANVDDVRIATNFAWHVENGRSTSGYFRITPDDCIELGGGSGNADVDLQDCAINSNPDGSVEYVLNFAVESTFGAAQNNQVSAIWYEQGVSTYSWTRLTQSGAGFDVVAGGNTPAALGGFSLGRASVEASGSQVQTFRMTLDDAANVDDVRFVINFAWHVENGLATSGYFQVTPTLCRELGSSANVELLDCAIEDNADGSKTYVAQFTVAPGYTVSQNNQVSAIWYEQGVSTYSWTRISQPGAGFDVTSASQGSLRSFAFDRASVVANGSQVQTYRLTLNDAGNVDDVRIATNFAWHVENGRSTSGYFRITPTTCVEVGAGSGNADVALQSCSSNANPDGSVEYVLNFAVESTFGAAQNNQVSAVWYEQGVSVASWTRVTQSGAGFDVTSP